MKALTVFNVLDFERVLSIL